MLITACSTQRKVELLPEPAKPEAPMLESVLKRTIKDEDMRKSNDDKSPKKRVVVLPFLDRNLDHSDAILKNAKEAFINQLNRTQDLIAIDSSELKLDLTKYIKNTEYDLTKLVQDTQNSGVSSLLVGKVIDVRFKSSSEIEITKDPKRVAFEIVVQAKLMNVRSGQELFNTVKTVTIEEENTRLPENMSSDLFFNKNPELVELLIKDAMMDFSTKLADAMKQIMWEGRIAALQGEKIYLNVGQISGVQVGDILKVVEDGNEIYDPEVGYHIGKVPGKIKGTLEVVGFFGQDGAVSIIHSGAGFKENDRIELYQ